MQQIEENDRNVRLLKTDTSRFGNDIFETKTFRVESDKNNVFTDTYRNEYRAAHTKWKNYKFKTDSSRVGIDENNELLFASYKQLSDKIEIDFDTLVRISESYKDGSWTLAQENLKRWQPVSQCMDFIRRKHIERVEYIINEHEYAIPSGTELISNDKEGNFISDGYVYAGFNGSVDKNTNTSNYSGIWKGDPKSKISLYKKIVIVFKWKCNCMHPIVSDKNPIVCAKNPIVFEIYQHRWGDNNLIYSRSCKEHHALRDFSTQTGISLDKLGFPYPWPTQVSIIKPGVKPDLGNIEKELNVMENVLK